MAGSGSIRKQSHCPKGLYVFRHSALMDRYGEQVSIINVRLYDQVQSHPVATAPWATFRLDGKDTYAD